MIINFKTHRIIKEHEQAIESFHMWNAFFSQWEQKGLSLDVYRLNEMIKLEHKEIGYICAHFLIQSFLSVV